VLDKIYIDNQSKFYAYAKRQFPSVPLEDVEDIYQDTIIVFYQNIRREILVEIKSNLSAYIIQIGKIKLIHYVEKERKKTNLFEMFKDSDISIDEYDHKIDLAVKFIFSKMSDSCKQILNLFYFEKKTMDEIATLLEYKNSDTVKSKKSRCISNFYKNVTNMSTDEFRK
jgi:RNA polymerase sigma-70 factor (ECF subfamily)